MAKKNANDEKDINRIISTGINRYLSGAITIMNSKDIYVIISTAYDNYKVYKYNKMNDNEYKLEGINIILDDITNSIIIFDCNDYKHDLDNNLGNNFIIFISNCNNYSGEKIANLYIDSPSTKEIQDWHRKCIGCAIDNETIIKYGNNPRYLQNRYVYNTNLSKEFLQHFLALIDGVVGTIGRNTFIKKYLLEETIGYESNIILKYNYQTFWNDDFDNIIVKPKEKRLQYISKDVENYIISKYYPPLNYGQYVDLKKYYNMETNEPLKYLALKQLIAYEIGTNIIHIYPYSVQIQHKRNGTVTYFPNINSQLVQIIVDEENYFDFIVYGVFIKILSDKSIVVDNTIAKKSIEV